MRRMMLGLSQEKLGDSLGLTFQQIQKYEKGTNRIGASRLYQISHILQVPVAFSSKAHRMPRQRAARKAWPKLPHRPTFPTSWPPPMA